MTKHMKHMVIILSVLLAVSPIQAREGKEKAGTADINIGVGELQESAVKGQDRDNTKLIEKTSSGHIKGNSNNTPAALPEPKIDSRSYRE